MQYIKTFEQFITEGLIKTADIVCVGNIINNDEIFKKLNGGYENKSEYSFIINFKKLIYYDHFKHISNLINNLGYFITMYIHSGMYRVKMTDDEFRLFERKMPFENIYFSCEAKFSKTNKFYPKLYHLTTVKNAIKIEKIGLCPKNKNKKTYHPSRVYLATDLTYLRNSVPIFKPHFLEDDILCILEIDNSDNILQLNIDDKMPNGVFTYNNIKPKRIKKLYNIK